MVKHSRRLKFAWAILALMLYALVSGQAHSTQIPAQLKVQLDKSTSTLGEPLQLRVSAPFALNALDLSALQTDFEIFARAASLSTVNGKSLGVLDATLYPLRSGRLILPALHLEQASSRALTLEVAPAPLDLSAWLAPATPMEREATTLFLQFKDEGDLSFIRPTIDAPHIAWTALPDATGDDISQDKAAAKSGLRILRWSLLPLQSGGLSLHFSMLDAYRFGQRLRYPLPTVGFRATHAPAYLPLSLPIGQPRMTAEALPAQWQAGQPYSWNIQIEAPGLSPEGALKLLHYEVTPGLRFYAPTASVIKRQGYERIQISLNVVAERGQRSVPALQFPYFDPKTQQLRALHLPPQTIQVSDPNLRKKLAAVLAACSVLLLIALVNKIAPKLRARQIRRHWLQTLGASENIVQLYRALSNAAPWTAPTVERWPAALRASVPAQSIRELEALRFGPIGSNAASSEFIRLKKVWQGLAAALPLQFFYLRAR